MLSNYLRSVPPFFQLVIFFLFASLSSMLFVVTGQLLAGTIWGVDAFNPEALYDYDNPDSMSALRMVTFFYQFGFFILPSLVYARFLHDSRGRYLMADRKFDVVNTILSIGAVLCTFYIINWLVYVNELIPLGGEFGNQVKQMHDDNLELSTHMLSGTGMGTYLVNMFVLAVVPAVGEELMFRGMFMRMLTRATRNVHAGIWLTALLFGLIHLQFYNFLAIVFMGALFGYLLIWTGNIWIPIIAHFLNNAVTVTLSHLINSGKLSEDVDMFPDNYISLGVSLVAFTILLLVIQGSSKWHAIKYDYLRQ